ncbi:MAG: hypothetical protein NTW29_15205 [Bacteroidetes bacterium]|nr:hypothetical protein [Bacteroidota bacterium]
MKRLLLLCAGWPFFADAQEVKPILSPEYQALIRRDTGTSVKTILFDSTNDMRKANLRHTGYYFNEGTSIRKIVVNKQNELKFIPVRYRTIRFSGNASIMAGVQQPGRGPSLQQEYVQGRSAGGSLQWRGAETGELFSYGPAISTLLYDGSSYPYDMYGRLVPLSGGNDGTARKAIPYDNSILRTGAFLSNAVALFGTYEPRYTRSLSVALRASSGKEQTIIRGNTKKIAAFSTSMDGRFEKMNLSLQYSFRQEKSDHSNRNGFLNRVYQNSLITPISFSNKQGTYLNGVQRSFSTGSDNPLFLLADKGHGFLQQQQGFAFSAEQRINTLRFKLVQSMDIRRQISREGYQPSTAFFASGIDLQRQTRYHNYTFNPSVTWDFHYKNSDKVSGQVNMNYIHSRNSYSIDYSIAHKDHRYNRSLHEMSLFYSNDFRDNYFSAGLQLQNKIYISGTSRDAFFLPGISLYIQDQELLKINRLSGKLFGSFNRHNHEMPLSTSYAGYNLLQYSTANALQYLPVNEVNSYRGLLPVRNREFTAGLELSYYSKVYLTATWFSRTTLDDLIPVPAAGGGLELINMASYRNKGIEIQLSNGPWIFNNRKFGLGHAISFNRNRNKVTGVKTGFNNTPIAGFSDVHKTLVLGQPLGVITGSTWLRNATGDMIIGNDGYPLVNPAPAIIGDPNPDFTIKLNQNFSYQGKWELRIDWVWNKGGDLWNGTAAMLDYFGRSATSAIERNITGYVFQGVTTSGGHNTIPVSFYDPSQPLEQNRWVRYGPSGVAAPYIQKADNIRIQNLSISYKPVMRKKIKELSFSLYASNILLWSAYKGADPTQLLYDMPATQGLDFFNLPAVRSFGFSSSIQF